MYLRIARWSLIRWKTWVEASDSQGRIYVGTANEQACPAKKKQSYSDKPKRNQRKVSIRRFLFMVIYVLIVYPAADIHGGAEPPCRPDG